MYLSIYLSIYLPIYLLSIYLPISFPVVHCLLVFSRHISSLLYRHMSISVHHPLNFVFNIIFGSTSSPLSCWLPGHYSLRQYSILHANFMSILFQYNLYIYYSFQNCVPSIFSITLNLITLDFLAAVLQTSISVFNNNTVQ